VLISCGEPSGDVYAGALVRELRRIDPNTTVSGLGGPSLAAAGGVVLEDYRGLAVTGLTEAIAQVPRSYFTLRRLAEVARDERPDVLVVIDFPDFNLGLVPRLGLAPIVKRLGIPVVYYIPPQLWAWRPKRLERIRRVADRVLVIFPFEEAIYRDGGVPVEFVGHPLVELTPPGVDRGSTLTRLGLDPTAPAVALLPGSRPSEVAHHLPTLVAAAERIRRDVPRAQFLIARAPHLPDSLFALPTSDSRPPTSVIEGDTNAVLSAADVVITASGTATVQTALHDKPMVIVYRVSRTTYWLLKRLVKVDTIGMVNLIAGERLVPELVQDAFTPEAVAREAVSMLTDASRAAQIRVGLARVRQRLGGVGASRRAADAILAVAAAKSSS
jgi:lipid-A-disaccharide synthase